MGFPINIRAPKGRDRREATGGGRSSPDKYVVLCSRFQYFQTSLRRSISRRQEREGQGELRGIRPRGSYARRAGPITPPAKYVVIAAVIASAMHTTETHDAVPPRGSDTSRYGQGDNRCNRHSYEEADITPPFIIRWLPVFVRTLSAVRTASREYEDQRRKNRGRAQEERCKDCS